MKNFSKKGAITRLVIFSISFVLLAVLSFVPFKLGYIDYNSFFGALGTTNRYSNGLTVTYNLTTPATEKELEDSIKNIANQLQDKGYQSTDIYVLDNDKIRIDIAEPVNKSEESNMVTFLESTLPSGRLQLKTVNAADANEETCVVIDGYKHVKSISVLVYKSQYGIKLELTKEGRNILHDNLGKTFYMYVGNEPWPSKDYNTIETNAGSQENDLTLWFSSSSVIDSYNEIMLAGTIAANLDAENVEVMYTKVDNTPLLITSICVGVLMLAVIIYLILKFKWLGVILFAGFANSIFLGLFIFPLVPWIELDIASIILATALTIISIVPSIIFVERIKREYSKGKSIITSLTDAYTSTKTLSVDTAFAQILSGVAFLCFFIDKLPVVGTIAIACGLISLLTNLVYVPSAVKTMYGFEPSNPNKYDLPAREEE